MFQHTAGRSPIKGGRLTQLVVLALAGAFLSQAVGQEVVHVAGRLGPEEQDSRQGSRLQWKVREPTGGHRIRRAMPSPAQTDDGPRLLSATEQPAVGIASAGRSLSAPARFTLLSAKEQPTAARSWRGTFIRSPKRLEGGPEYAVVDHLGLKRRYLRTPPDVDLDQFLDREVTVLRDTGLILDLDQVELGGQPSRGRVARADYEHEPAGRMTEVREADYEDTAPAFRPSSRAGRSEGTTPPGDRPQNATPPDTQREPIEPTAPPAAAEQEPDTGSSERIAQRMEQLPLTTATGQPLMTGERIVIPPPGMGKRGGICPLCGQPHGASGCVCGARGTWWGRAEYLYWWMNGFEVPPLVTTSPAGTPQAQAGVLGEPTTTVLFGNGDVLDEAFHGARFTGGYWLRGADKLGIEGDYLGLVQESVRFSIFGNNGSPIIARPFFNLLDGAEDASLVAFPGLIEGTAIVEGASDLEMAGLRLRIAACCSDLPTFRATSRVDFLAGYRFAQLDEQLSIREDSVSLDVNNPGSFLVQDAFLTHNEFHGGEAGVVWEFDRPRWALELVGRIAIGSNQQDVVINGSTTVSDNGFSLTQTGGILAQRTNIGHYERNRLSVIPQLAATFSFKVTQRLRLTAGYTFLYWSRVVRPGDPIDLDVNPNLFPPEADPFSGPLRPQFAWRESDLWAHGVSAGLDYRW